MARTPEDKVKDKITKWLDSQDLYWERRVAMGIGYKKGLPDIWFLYKGKHVELEIKAPGGKRSSMQYKYEEILRKHGAYYFCVDNLEELKKELEKI